VPEYKSIEGSGERQSSRDARERLEQRFVQGGMDRRTAEQRSREVARRGEHTIKRR
jgi:hypothetical protein